MINYQELSDTFYNLLALTHPDYKTTIVHKSNGNTVAICKGIEYKIDKKAIHLMNVGNSSNKIYYSLVQTNKHTKKGTIRIINVLHAISDDSDKILIFLSESDVDDDIYGLNDSDMIDEENNLSSDFDMIDIGNHI